jgi:hypothetical protein
MSLPEFHVGEEVFLLFLKAADKAVRESLRRGGDKIEIDVVCFDREAARLWAGDDGVEQYDDDPDASVFERLTVTVRSEGKVP